MVKTKVNNTLQNVNVNVGGVSLTLLSLSIDNIKLSLAGCRLDQKRTACKGFFCALSWRISTDN